MTSELALVPQEVLPPNIWTAEGPVAVVQEITAVAQVLKSVIEQNHLAVNISGRQYVRVEGWTLIAPLLKAWPKGAPKTRPLINEWCAEHYPAPCGYESEIELARPDGSSVGGGVAECSRHERTWAKRDDYAIKSMSQTRAVGKAYRMSFGFVMVAAGYEATPAEEMPRDEPKPASYPWLSDLNKQLREHEIGLGDVAQALEVPAVDRAEILHEVDEWLKHGQLEELIAFAVNGTSAKPF
jgi:hypothetical protein